MHVFLLLVVPLAYVYLLVLRDESAQPAALTSISVLRGGIAHLFVVVALLFLRRFIPRPYSGVPAFLYATGYDFFLPIVGGFGLFLWFTPDVLGLSSRERELSFLSFLAGNFMLAAISDLLLRSDYSGTYELFLLPSLRVAAMFLVPVLYLLFSDETFWFRYLYLAAIFLTPALLGTVFLLHIMNLHLAAIAATVLLFAGGWAAALFVAGGGVKLFRLR